MSAKKTNLNAPIDFWRSPELPDVNQVQSVLQWWPLRGKALHAFSSFADLTGGGQRWAHVHSFSLEHQSSPVEKGREQQAEHMRMTFLSVPSPDTLRRRLDILEIHWEADCLIIVIQ
eukprot:3392012-Amphidinium_carterae.1